MEEPPSDEVEACFLYTTCLSTSGVLEKQENRSGIRVSFWGPMDSYSAARIRRCLPAIILNSGATRLFLS